MLRRAVTALFALLIAASACAPGQDNPTSVHDLRVLGLSLDPPDVLIHACNLRLFGALAYSMADGGVPSLPPQLQDALLAEASRPIQLKALVLDPKGKGRTVRGEVRVCANQGDRACINEGDNLQLMRDDAFATGDRVVPLSSGAERSALGTLLLPDGTPLLLEVFSQDTYKGLGGFRVPMVLHLTADDTAEDLYAQKLMVYTCNFFPGMKANVTPELPGMIFEGEEWKEGELREVSGPGPFTVQPMDFTDLQEPYIVPSFQLQPVALTESWKVSSYTTVGTMKSHETGGTGLDGVSEAHRNAWQPDHKVTEPTDVDFYFVVRDGRGGQSWLHRQLHWTP